MKIVHMLYVHSRQYCARWRDGHTDIVTYLELKTGKTIFVVESAIQESVLAGLINELTRI